MKILTLDSDLEYRYVVYVSGVWSRYVVYVSGIDMWCMCLVSGPLSGEKIYSVLSCAAMCLVYGYRASRYAAVSRHTTA